MLKSVNPADGTVVFEGPWSSDDDVRDSIRRACDAFKPWSRTPLQARESIVRRFAAYVAENAEPLSQLIMREVGKLRSDAAAEVAAVVAKAEITIEMHRSRRGELESEARAVISQIRYRPLGVVVVLGPFNFPAHLPGGHIIPALLAGNAVVFKPSELAPAVGQWLADAWQHAGLPHGVIQLIQGPASVAKSAIDDPRITGVLFTGGHRSGTAIHRQLAGRPEVMLALEMGGNNPVVVVPPYDIDEAARTIATSAFISAGQRCTCARRLIVLDNNLGKQTIDRLVRIVGEMKIGLPSDGPDVDMGPVVSAAAASRLLETQGSWISSGGIAMMLMERSLRSNALLTPGIIDMTVSHPTEEDEWFGPLLQVYRVKDFDAAIALACSTRFGLAAGLIGGTEEMFDQFRCECQVGIVNWNVPTTGASSRLPFGGVGRSGNHRPAGSFAVDFCDDPIASMLVKPKLTHENGNL